MFAGEKQRRDLAGPVAIDIKCTNVFFMWPPGYEHLDQPQLGQLLQPPV